MVAEPPPELVSVICTICIRLASQQHFLFSGVRTFPSVSIPSVSLVNKAVVDYFFVELGVESHFEALRHFLLMEDGEFAQSLSDLLFEKVKVHTQNMMTHLIFLTRFAGFEYPCLTFNGIYFIWLISTALALFKTFL